jgi:hypothetical protein
LGAVIENGRRARHRSHRSAYGIRRSRRADIAAADNDEMVRQKIDVHHRVAANLPLGGSRAIGAYSMLFA